MPQITRVKKIVVALLFLLAARTYASTSVLVLDVAGAIGPASADYITRGLEQASDSGANLVVLQLDTPGGLDKSMRQIIKAILNSDIPVATYISPKGARAASAGTYIIYASHFAAMAPATNLGAATPVQIATPKLPSMPSPDSTDPANNEEKTTPMEQKIINDATAYIKGLAQLRGRNADWAVKAVREAQSLSASAALNRGVIDLVANNIDDLLKQLNGKKTTINNVSVELHTHQATIAYVQSDWRNKFLAVITDPNVAYVLMLLGIYGLLLEFYNPGMALPGIVGAVSIMLALYAFQVLPISYAGLGLIILGILLMIAESLAPSFGILGFGGLVAFTVGSVMLMDTRLPAYQIALPIILALSLISAGVLVVMLGMLIRARRQSAVTGLPTLEGEYATVESLSDGQAMIRLQGELWQVNADQALNIGDRVQVAHANGVVLKVKKVKGE